MSENLIQTNKVIKRESHLERAQQLQQQMAVNSHQSIMALSTITLPGDVQLTEIRKVGTPPLSALVKSGDKTECYKLVSSMIVLLNEYFGITWTNFQVASCSKEFYSHYFYWHQLDLKNFFRLCKQMQLAPKLLSVNQFSPIIFAEWAREYNQIWISTSEEISGLKSDATNYDPERESRIYQMEVADKVNARTSKERVDNLQDLVQYQQMQIEKLRGSE